MDLWVVRRACSKTVAFRRQPAPNSRSLRGEVIAFRAGGRASGLMIFLKTRPRRRARSSSGGNHAQRGARWSWSMPITPRYRDLYRLEGEGGA